VKFASMDIQKFSVQFTVIILVVTSETLPLEIVRVTSYVPGFANWTVGFSSSEVSGDPPSNAQENDVGLPVAEWENWTVWPVPIEEGDQVKSASKGSGPSGPQLHRHADKRIKVVARPMAFRY
jgi:hypothetical protein